MSQAPAIRLVNITLLNFLARIIFYVFVFGAGWYAARTVSREAFGQLQFVTFVAGLSWTLLSFGVPNLLSRYLTRSVAAGSRTSVAALLRYAGSALLLTIVLMSIAYVLFFKDRHVGVPVWLMIVFTLSQFLANCMQVLIQSVYRYKTAFSITLVAVITGAVMVYTCLPVHGIIAYIYTFIIVNLILSVGFGIPFMKAVSTMEIRAEGYELPLRKELIRTSGYFALSAILAAILWQRTEFYLLEKLFTFSDLAVYGVAFTLIALFFEPLKLLTGTLAYYYAGIMDAKQGEQQFQRFFAHFCWLVIFTGSFVWFNAEAIVGHIYPATYADAAIYLKWLVIGMTPGVCSYVVMNMLIGLGQSRFLLIQDFVCAIVFCTLVTAGTLWSGLQGTAVAKSIAMLLSVSMGIWYTAQRMKFSIPWKLPLFSVLLSVALGAVSRSMLLQDAWMLPVKFVLLYGVYVLVSYLTGMVDRGLFEKMGQELRKLFRPA
jgi:O-antigen/teichoic acid export membrane protein